MPTIKDVAREAKVSKSTVSLAINGSTAVKQETRELVLAAIKKLGYIPNVNARSLISKRTNNLGVIMLVEKSGHCYFDFGSDTDFFHHDIASGIPGALEGTDYGLLTEEFCLREAAGELPKLIRNHRVDGVFVVGSLIRQDFIDQISETKLPCVLVGCEVSEIDSVMPDVEQATYQSTRYLIETGHKKICLINCPTVFMTNALRKKGMSAAREELGGDVGCMNFDTGSNSGEGGYRMIRHVWEAGMRPDAIIAANDNIALGIMRYFYEQNIRIPEEVSIVSYDDSVLSAYAVPALTTTDIHKNKLGEKACEILLRRIGNPAMCRTSMIMPVDLVLRASVRKR